MANELIFYNTPEGEQRIDVVYEDEELLDVATGAG